jgi:hypothetical protein
LKTESLLKILSATINSSGGVVGQHSGCLESQKKAQELSTHFYLLIYFYKLQIALKMSHKMKGQKVDLATLLREQPGDDNLPTAPDPNVQ